MAHPQRRGALGPRRAVRIRAFDGRHEVLHKRELIHMVDIESPMFDAMLPAFLAQAVELAHVLENEPMPHARIEVWCVVSGRKLRDYAGGLV